MPVADTNDVGAKQDDGDDWESSDGDDNKDSSATGAKRKKRKLSKQEKKKAKRKLRMEVAAPPKTVQGTSDKAKKTKAFFAGM
ncbi:hypothetical protein EV175_003716 [Coemansia sp. RSA 1933]|nr:hypothetical protein EV175_003716 [Coemansia sp. RSA 1933]